MTVVLIIVLIVVLCPFPNIKPETASNVACVMFNARSLCNKLVELHYLLYLSKFDILLITESWLHEGITNGLLDPEGKFTVLRCDRFVTSREGVCAFANNSLQVTPVNLGKKYFNLELLCFDLVAPNSYSLICYFLVYRAPSFLIMHIVTYAY